MDCDTSDQGQEMTTLTTDMRHHQKALYVEMALSRILFGMIGTFSSFSVPSQELSHTRLSRPWPVTSYRPPARPDHITRPRPNQTISPAPGQTRPYHQPPTKPDHITRPQPNQTTSPAPDLTRPYHPHPAKPDHSTHTRPNQTIAPTPGQTRP